MIAELKLHKNKLLFFMSVLGPKLGAQWGKELGGGGGGDGDGGKWDSFDFTLPLVQISLKWVGISGGKGVGIQRGFEGNGGGGRGGR